MSIVEEPLGIRTSTVVIGIVIVVVIVVVVGAVIHVAAIVLIVGIKKRRDKELR